MVVYKGNYVNIRRIKTPEDRQWFKDKIYAVYPSISKCAKDAGIGTTELEGFIRTGGKLEQRKVNCVARACGFDLSEVFAHTVGKRVVIKESDRDKELNAPIPDMSKPLTVETINDGGVLNLAAAIVGSVAKEYKFAVRKAKRNGIDRDEYERRLSEFVELKNIKELREYLTTQHSIASAAFKRTGKVEHLARIYACIQLRGVIKAEEGRIRDQIAPVTKIINCEEYFYSDDFRALADINPNAVIEKVWRDVWKDKNLKISHMRGNA